MNADDILLPATQMAELHVKKKTMIKLVAQTRVLNHTKPYYTYLCRLHDA